MNNTIRRKAYCYLYAGSPDASTMPVNVDKKRNSRQQYLVDLSDHRRRLSSVVADHNRRHRGRDLDV